VDKIIEGEPALADAARPAIRQWRGAPGQLGDKRLTSSHGTFTFKSTEELARRSGVWGRKSL